MPAALHIDGHCVGALMCYQLETKNLSFVFLFIILKASVEKKTAYQSFRGLEI
jgi:hypothetical protein